MTGRRRVAVISAVNLVVLFGVLIGVSHQAGAVGGWTATLTPGQPQPVQAGDPLEYSYQVQCSTPSGCGTITATIPAPVGWTKAAGAPTVDISPGLTGMTFTVAPDGTLTVVWVNPPPGQSNQVQLNWPTVNYLTPPAPQPVTATVTDGTTTEKPTATDQLAAAPAPVVTKTAPATIDAGTDLRYTVTAYNYASSGGAGGLALTHTTITDPLPSGVTYVSCAVDDAPAGTTCAEAAGVVTFTIPGDFYKTPTFVGTVTVAVPEDTAHGTQYSNTATLTGTPLGASTPVTADATATTTVSGTAPVVNGVQQKTGPTAVVPGSTNEYTLSVTNNGTAPATATIHDDDLPTGIFHATKFDVVVNGAIETRGDVSATVTYSDHTTDTFTNTASPVNISFDLNPVFVTAIDFTVNPLPAGGRVEIDLTGFTPADVALATQGTNCITSTLTVGATTTATSPAESCVTTTVTPTEFDTKFLKYLDPTTPVTPLGTQTWHLSVNNDFEEAGTSALTPYIIDLIPPNVTYVSGSFGLDVADSTTGGACPTTSDFGVTVIPNYLDGRTAIIATTATAPGKLTDGTTPTGGTGAQIANFGAICNYLLQTTVDADVAEGSYGGDPTGTVGQSTYPISPTYAGNDAYLFAANPGGGFDAVNQGIQSDSSDVRMNGNTTEGVLPATADFSVAASSALQVVKEVKGDQDSTFFTSAEINPAEHGTSSPGGTVSWQVTLGDNGNEPETHVVAYDILPSDAIIPGATGTNSGVTAIRYADPSSNAKYENQFIPTMTGPITVGPNDPVTILYSTNPNPCRPEMTDPANSVAAVFCGGNYQANNDWLTATQVGGDWSAVRAIRFEYGNSVFQPESGPTCGTLADGCFVYTWTMNVPTTDSSGAALVSGSHTWNKVAADGDTDIDGTLTPLLPTEAPWAEDLIHVSSATSITPTVGTTISLQTATLGATLSDVVAVGNTGGATIGGTWELVGPVAPGAGGTCATSDWTGAPTFDSGSFSVTGNGSVTTASTKAITVSGCYSFVDSLAATATTTAVGLTAAGAATETALVRTTPPGPPTLAFTGSNVARSAEIGGLLILLGGDLLLLLRRESRRTV